MHALTSSIASSDFCTDRLPLRACARSNSALLPQSARNRTRTPVRPIQQVAASLSGASSGLHTIRTTNVASKQYKIPRQAYNISLNATLCLKV